MCDSVSVEISQVKREALQDSAYSFTIDDQCNTGGYIEYMLAHLGISICKFNRDVYKTTTFEYVFVNNTVNEIPDKCNFFIAKSNPAV